MKNKILKKSERMQKVIDLGKLNNLPPVLHNMEQNYTIEQMKELIDRNKGIISLMVIESGYNYRQIYNCFKHYELMEYFQDAKKSLVSEAEKVLLETLYSDSETAKMKAVELILRSRAGQDAGYGQNPAVQIQQNIVSDKDKMTQIKNVFGISNEKED